MAVYLISYDLVGPETSASYEQLIAHIKGLGAWAKPLYSQWLVDTTASAAEIRDGIRRYLDTNDRVLVVYVSTPWASLGLAAEVADWMKSRL